MQPQSAGFGDPQAVAEHQQDEAAVAGLGAAAAGSGDQALDLARREVFAVAHCFVQCSAKKRGAKPRRCWGWWLDIRQNGSFRPKHTHWLRKMAKIIFGVSFMIYLIKTPCKSRAFFTIYKLRINDLSSNQQDDTFRPRQFHRSKCRRLLLPMLAPW